jgi:hypothetical protein
LEATATQAPAAPAATEAPAQAAAPADTAASATATATGIPLAVPTEIPGLKPGDTKSVEIKNLPANTDFRLTQGTLAGRPVLIGNGTSDAAGVLRLTIEIPSGARAGEIWYVFARPLSGGEQYKSDPMEIGGAPGQ